MQIQETSATTELAVDDLDQELEALLERRRIAAARLETLKIDVKNAESECRSVAWDIEGHRSRQAGRR
jgi:hypothetical protein